MTCTNTHCLILEASMLLWLFWTGCLSFFTFNKEREPSPVPNTTTSFSIPAHRFFHGFWADTPSCIIPFTMAGKLMLIRAQADTMTGNFILDTGAPHLLLNITYFRDYPATEESGAEQSDINGSAQGPILKTNINEFTLGTFHYNRMEAHLANLGHIENARGVKILGLVGMDIFRECEMIIDYEKNLIYLHRISRKEAATYQSEMLNDTSTFRTIPIDIMDSRIVATTEIAGKKLKVIVDCAAESSILNSKLPNKIFEYVTIDRRVQLTGAGNKKTEALYGNVKGMKIGGYELAALPILITNLENTCFSYNGCIDGVLGFDFLSLHKVGFNFVKRKMYIWK